MLIALVILAYQTLGGLAEWAITADIQVAVQDVRIGFPGMLFQLFGGWTLLSIMAKYER
jgi:enoyl-CoA hydratase/carnithine racemase